jgi:undecaprenyl phosphate-alpha-L-ara4N flippase subunit ArnE
MLLVLAAAFVGSFAAVALKKGSARLKKGLRHMLNPYQVLGVVIYVASSVLFVLGIKHGELSVLYPMVSLGYIFTLLWSRLFFREPFTRQKLAGLGLIIGGVVLVGLGSQ